MIENVLNIVHHKEPVKHQIGETRMYKKIIIAVVCVATIAILSTGCQMTGTQKGTAAG
ncbi:MAG: hypothetical protein HN402_11590, partial [Candidatus Scalindua sp.]|nr:hypothetical protein [Candidatus Scalindua sp.]